MCTNFICSYHILTHTYYIILPKPIWESEWFLVTQPQPATREKSLPVPKGTIPHLSQVGLEGLGFV